MQSQSVKQANFLGDDGSKIYPKTSPSNRSFPQHFEEKEWPLKHVMYNILYAVEIERLSKVEKKWQER